MPDSSCGKLFESTDITGFVRMERALMRAKPRCGHGVAFAKVAKRPSWLFFEMAGSSNLPNRQLPHRQQVSHRQLSAVPK